jgi:hypothetical protein
MFDIIGAFLVAIEVVRVFRGPTTLDMGDSGAVNGSTFLTPNPEFEAHERRKRRTMKIGLAFLVAGFLLQGVGVWLGVLNVT